MNWISTYEASSPAFEFATKDDMHSFDGGAGIFSGTVINNSGQDLSSVIVTVSIYNASTGELMATNSSFVPEILLNNGTGSYEVFLYPPEEYRPAKYQRGNYCIRPVEQRLTIPSSNILPMGFF